jgi:hypothetical protein
MADPPRVSAETVIVDLAERPLVLIEAALWPPIGAIIELRQPIIRDTVVRDVRLRVFETSGRAGIEVQVDDPLTHPL